MAHGTTLILFNASHDPHVLFYPEGIGVLCLKIRWFYSFSGLHTAQTWAMQDVKSKCFLFDWSCMQLFSGI
jgi:hypothetical protein